MLVLNGLVYCTTWITNDPISAVKGHEDGSLKDFQALHTIRRSCVFASGDDCLRRKHANSSTCCRWRSDQCETNLISIHSACDSETCWSGRWCSKRYIAHRIAYSN